VSLENQIRHERGLRQRLRNERYCLLESTTPVDAAVFTRECEALLEEKMELLELIVALSASGAVPAEGGEVTNKPD
jgi:hypothetical protein